jgi:hypothetical protein
VQLAFLLAQLGLHQVRDLLLFRIDVMLEPATVMLAGSGRTPDSLLLIVYASAWREEVR